LQVFKNQTSARRDFLATLSTLASILEIFGSIDESCSLLDVKDDELFNLHQAISGEMSSAVIEAENFELYFQQPPMRKTGKPLKKTARKIPSKATV
jgi:hypothetical protein